VEYQLYPDGTRTGRWRPRRADGKQWAWREGKTPRGSEPVEGASNSRR
jgi:hypothetical protein